MDELLRKALDLLDREDTAEYMAELLMDETQTTWKMYEKIASAYLNGNKDYRKGLNDSLIYLTGWSLETITNNLLERKEG